LKGSSPKRGYTGQSVSPKIYGKMIYKEQLLINPPANRPVKELCNFIPPLKDQTPSFFRRKNFPNFLRQKVGPGNETARGNFAVSCFVSVSRPSLKLLCLAEFAL